jgi:hypothetical protein
MSSSYRYTSSKFPSGPKTMSMSYKQVIWHPIRGKDVEDLPIY